MHPPRNIVVGALASVLTVLPGTALLAAQAGADPVDLVCAGAQTTTFTPGLTLATTPTSVTSRGQLGPCVSLSEPAITAGAYGSTFVRNTSCLTLLNAGTGNRVFTWSNGRTSTFSFSSTSTYVAGQLVTTLRGTITAGAFTGSSALQVTTLVADLTRCLLPGGLTDGTGVTDLTIYL